ncbi:iron complex outermembrane receptor protein [Pseudoduganella flava]|uniref:Iron complex outermembrane receptor protein n=1 Tax=Pseudoduganella flava TaxID=871742 RepID=A0A562Q3S4_9BURK|nr:TonB-dependent receptor [Pseudoduganella flava]QGZ41453.1 TonB-dependent receptor [Pseudoduganella flava]TWI51409.1 iron complex outermembrane receptor protein [Pseudoduganella flava]
MHRNTLPAKALLAAAIASLFAGTAAAQSTSTEENQATVVVTGTRVSNRTVLDTASPVDIISADTIKNTGVPEITQALSVALPSLNFPRPGLADGTDTIRPATLRGLAPDQTLVLVNSKRRHTSSLVNLNGTIGRGSAAVDMNTIPTGIVKNIEVLRDGASAQYGSDAIAGVVNIRLRQDRKGGEATVSYGERITDYSFNPVTPPAGATWGAQNERSRHDGETKTASVWKGLPLGETGYLTIAGEFKKQEHTERSGYDTRQQYPLVNGQFDPREATINRFNAWYGEPELKQSTVFANMGGELSEKVKWYGWASYQKREARSGGFFRRALQDNNTIQIYPDGFLPIIAPDVDDFSAAGGVTWNAGGWDMDSSLSYGKNKMDFTIENTLNRSLGTASKTVFDAGGFSYDQLTYNLSGVRQFDVGLASALNVAIGAEARREGYKLEAGEPDSWRNGGVLLPSGLPTASGSQVFPGFRPSDESDAHRTAYSVYADFEANVLPALLASFAVRGEHYSDFGNNWSGKLAGRYDFTPNFGIRGSVQNGFRAPSMQQQFFTSTSTNFVNGIPYDITTFQPTAPAAVALGAKPLDAEKSTNFSLGAVAKLGKGSLTVDGFHIKIRNRIVLSENLLAANVRDYLTSHGFPGVGGGRFFINGVDTTTKGVDVVFNYPWTLGAAGRFDLTVAGNYTNTEVTKVPTTAELAALSPAPVLFDRVNVLTFEQGTPKTKFTASGTWSMGPFGATLRATRYGKVLTPGTTPALDHTMSAQTLVDLEGRYAITKALSLAIGAENLFDQYPDAYPAALNTTGNAPFTNYSPFGRSGRFVYARLTYAL